MEVFEKNIDKLISSVEEKTGVNSVLYIELISLEIKENSFFRIAGKGYNKDIYLDKVKNHLREEENTSLLLMKHIDDSGLFFLQKELLKQEDVNNIDDKRRFYSIKRNYHKIDTLSYSHITTQWEKWLQMAQTCFKNMQHACFLHSNLEIPFSQNSVEITSAVWVFFSCPVSDPQSLLPILQTGIYEYIIYTLLPDKIKQIERQDTFKRLFHSQKQYLRALEGFSGLIETEKAELLQYLIDFLRGFLEISRFINEDINSFKHLELNISQETIKMVKIFEELIFKSEDILDNSLKLNSLQRQALLAQYENNNLFGGNFRTAKISNLNLPIYVPQLVIKEAFVNALENCNENSPQVSIDFEENEDSVTFRITNNINSNVSELYEIINKNDDNQLGLKVINELCEKMKWKFAIDSRDNKTWIEFRINKKTYE